MLTRKPRLLALLLVGLITPVAFADLITPHPISVPPTQFTYTDAKAKNVFLIGEFNHWNTSATPMQRGDSGAWTASVPLLPGRHEYKFFVDGRYVQDFANPKTAPDGFGGKNSVVEVINAFADAVVEEKEALREKTAQLFDKNDFAALEKLSDELRTSKARFSDGLWKLMEFYNGVQAEKTMRDQEDWQPWFDKVAQWEKAFPESITEPVVMARGWTDYAWKARGTSYAYAVKKEAWKGFAERLAKAREILEAAAKSRPRCPNWFGVMQTVALGQNWTLAANEQLLADAAKAEPTFYQIYWNAAYFLMPRWNGRPGDWERLAEKAAIKFDPEEGMTAYTRTAWFMSDWYDDLFHSTRIEWPKMKQGFIDIEKRFPNSRWNLNAFCRFAVKAGDRETARKLFERIGEHGDPNWGGYGRYEFSRRWADPATPRWQIEPAMELIEPGAGSRNSEKRRGAIHAVAFSPDGKLLAAGGGNGRLNVFSASNGNSLWNDVASNDTVMSIQFSPDGKLIAVGAGEEHETTHPGVVGVWDVASKERIKSTQPAGTVWSVAFTPDGKTIVASGGRYNKQAEVSLIDISTGKVQPLDWAKEHNHGIHCVAVSPGGKRLATDCYKSITVWSMAEGKILFDKRNTLPTFSQSLAFSPDGKFVVVAGAPEWEQHDEQPGGLTIWSADGWTTKKNMKPMEDAGGLYAVAWSHDGKWIAGAGQDQAVHVWSATTLESKAIYTGHEGIVWAVAFSPDGKTLASGGDDGTIKLWKMPP